MLPSGCAAGTVHWLHAILTTALVVSTYAAFRVCCRQDSCPERSKTCTLCGYTVTRAQPYLSLYLSLSTYICIYIYKLSLVFIYAAVGMQARNFAIECVSLYLSLSLYIYIYIYTLTSVHLRCWRDSGPERCNRMRQDGIAMLL